MTEKAYTASRHFVWRYVLRCNCIVIHLLGISAFLFVYSSTVLASPTVNIDTKYYSIYGSSSKELRKEMNAKGSIGHSGNTYDAYTSWYINWRLNWNMNNGECHMTNVTSTCSALERKANTLGKNILNKYISIEKTYDQKNNHGISNGAKFP